jgi:hypothetical protein
MMMIIAIFIALLFLAVAVPTTALATNSTISPDCDDEECIVEDECTPFNPNKAMECARMFLL